MNEPTETVYITKYVFSRGIFPLTGIVYSDSGLFRPEDKSWFGCFHRNEWRATREEAVIQADKMRQQKVASLRRQIAKLEKMTF